jgi:hypothetical protein
MNNLDDILTDNTKVTPLKQIKVNQGLDKNNLTVFTKEYNINEVIGQHLAGIRNLNTNKYIFALYTNNYNLNKAKDIDIMDINKIMIASYDFKKKDCKYFTLDKLGFDGYKFIKILELCKSKENRDELTRELLELMALDTFMGQVDRFFYNIMFEVNEYEEIHLAPIYDYSRSLVYYDIDKPIYPNQLLELNKEEDYKQAFNDYPIFYEILKSYLDVDLVEEIKECFDERALDYSNFNLQKYILFEEKNKELISKIIK